MEGQAIWRLSSQNRKLNNPELLTKEGSSVSLRVSDAQLCGNSVEMAVYVEDQCLCKCSVWVHYRFRFLQRPDILKQVSDRVVNPWKIDQRSTALCGIACIFYLLAEDNPLLYRRSVLELHRVGFVLIHTYTIQPPTSLYDMNPASDDYPKGMPGADWIILASTRSKESFWGYRGRGREVLSAINWPPMLARLSRTLLNYDQVVFNLYSPLKTFLNDMLFSSDKVHVLISRIQRSFEAGAKMIMLIDLDLLYNRANYNFRSLSRYHWIVYEGDLRMEDRDGAATTDAHQAATIYFKSYTWGLAPDKSHTAKGISKRAFITNFYGYIEMFRRGDGIKKVGS